MIQTIIFTGTTSTYASTYVCNNLPLNDETVYDCGNSPINAGGTVCTPYLEGYCNICGGYYSG